MINSNISHVETHHKLDEAIVHFLGLAVGVAEGVAGGSTVGLAVGGDDIGQIHGEVGLDDGHREGGLAGLVLAVARKFHLQLIGRLGSVASLVGIGIGDVEADDLGTADNRTVGTHHVGSDGAHKVLVGVVTVDQADVATLKGGGSTHILKRDGTFILDGHGATLVS